MNQTPNSSGVQRRMQRLYKVEVIARAEAAKAQIQNHRGDLSRQERERLATNLGKILAQAKAAGVSMSEVVENADPPVPHNPGKPVDVLHYYRLVPGAKKRTGKRELHATPGRYLALALSAARLMEMPEHEAVLGVIDGTKLSDKPIREDSVEPAVRVLNLLEARLEEIALQHDLDGYIRQVTDLRVLPRLDDEGAFDWEVDLHGFDFQETSAWPQVLLTAIIRDRVDAVIKAGDTQYKGEAIYAERIYLTLGWDDQSKMVHPFLEVTAATAARTTGVDGLLNLNGPWITWRHPPATGAFWIRDEVVVGILPGRPLKNGVADQKDLRHINNDPYECSRLVRLDATALVEYLVEATELHMTKQTLPVAVDASELVSPPPSILAKLEAVLLDRHRRDTAVMDFGDSPDFLADLDLQAKRLTASFREWRAGARAKAIADHQLALAEAHERLALLRAQVPHSLADDEGLT